MSSESRSCASSGFNGYVCPLLRMDQPIRMDAHRTIIETCPHQFIIFHVEYQLTYLKSKSSGSVIRPLQPSKIDNSHFTYTYTLNNCREICNSVKIKFTSITSGLFACPSRSLCSSSAIAGIVNPFEWKRSCKNGLCYFKTFRVYPCDFIKPQVNIRVST